MFLRSKKVGQLIYLQIVENRWEKGKVRQRVLASLGRLDRLEHSGRLDAFLQSAARFSESLMVISAHRGGKLAPSVNRRIGPPHVQGPSPLEGQGSGGRTLAETNRLEE